MEKANTVLKFAKSRVRIVVALLLGPLIVSVLMILMARLVAGIPESTFPFPEKSIQLTGMPATFQAAVLPKWKIGQKISLHTPESLPRFSQNPLPTYAAEAVYFQGVNSRLTVVVPGLGGNSTDSMNVWFARPFLNHGDSVLILPSPSHPSFFEMYLASFDFHRSNLALCEVIKDFVTSSHFRSLKVSRVLLAGYSLGARNVLEVPGCLSSFLQQRELGMEVFSMNPPLDLDYAASVLDDALGAPAPLDVGGFAKALLVGLYTKLMAFSFQDFKGFQDVDEQALILAARRWTFFLENQDSSLKKIIATLFARKLRSTIQLAAKKSSADDADEGDFSFRILTSSTSDSQLTNLDQLLSRVNQVRQQTGGRFFILHSMDDFLIRPTDLQALFEFAPQQVLALPRGGHVGAVFQSEYVSGFGLGRSLKVFPPVYKP